MLILGQLQTGQNKRHRKRKINCDYINFGCLLQNRAIGLVRRVFAICPGDQGSISIDKGAFGSPSTKVTKFTYYKLNLLFC